jgi:hypothetical protein
MLNVKGSPLASRPIGTNAYHVPTVTAVDGVPVIVGATLLVGPLTVMLKGGSDTDLLPSLTEITMLLYVPTLVAPGVPRSRPVAVLHVAHAGWLRIENVSVLPSGSLATGRKTYKLPATTELAGVPEMTGGRFPPDCALETAGVPDTVTTTIAKKSFRQLVVILDPNIL